MKKKIESQIADLVREVDAYELNLASGPAYKKQFLSKEGSIHKLFQLLPTLPVSDRSVLGKQLNALKKRAEERYNLLKTIAPTNSLGDKQDITVPPPTIEVGTLHVLTQMQERVVSILRRIGFEVAEGPEIEDEWHNFSALNFPEHHPARDMQDTFFVTGETGEKMALRTQTSSVQVRVMERGELPIRILSVGRVFRKETISSRSHCVFHQVEGLYVDKGVSFIDLKEALTYFVHALFGEGVDMRLRPSYFPFTEPSAEIDIVCFLCKQKGCNVCKYSGWVEIGGAGMVDPQVLENCKISSEVYTGFAFGIGIERMAMLLAQIPDVRLFLENDLRFLKQFACNVNNFCT